MFTIATVTTALLWTGALVAIPLAAFYEGR